MASKKSAKALASRAKTSDSNSDALSSMDASQEASQGVTIDLKTVQDRMNQHKQQVMKRREARREAIMSKHAQNVVEIRKEYHDCHARYDETWRNCQRPKVEHLLALIRKKESLESQIEDCIAQVEQGFLALSDQLETALVQRVKQIST